MAVKPRYLGKKSSEIDLEEISLDPVEISPRVKEVKMTSDEVTALCPVTGQPDQYTVIIIFTSTGHTVESKSLKLYLQSYRNQGIFCEDFSAKILDDIVECIKPRHCEVTVIQKPRGGVSINAISTWSEPRGSISPHTDRSS